MPSPMYFHPFMDRNHYAGIGPKGLMTLPSSVSLHGVSPTFGKAHYKYLWKMAANNAVTTFQPYVANTDRIYVMGHGSPGSSVLSTESGVLNGDETCYDYELARYFERYGLQKTSQVHIRIHACNSATPSAANAHDSFAESFKACMTGRGYRNVTVRGYDRGTFLYLFYRWGEEFFERANDYAVDF